MATGRVRMAIALILSLLLLYWALHDVDLAGVLARVRGVRVWPLLGAALLITAAHFPIRVMRWRHLLRPEGAVLPFTPLFHATAVGTLMNYLLPVRMGELIRAYAARELTASSFSTALGSILTERVVDGIATCVMLFAAIAIGGFHNDIVVGSWTVGRVAAVASLVFGLAFVALFGIAFLPTRLRVAGRRLFGGRRGDSKWVSARSIIRGLIAGLDSLRSFERSVAAAAWSLLLWSVSACGVWLGLHAFGISVPLTLAVTLQALVALAIALPSAPGFVGPFEAAAKAALSLGAIDSTQALGFSLPFHIVAFFVPVTILGLWSLSRTGMRLTQLGAGAAKAAEEATQLSGRSQSAGRVP
jgi:uncharacterized protein (TIRG00374 family)